MNGATGEVDRSTLVDMVAKPQVSVSSVVGVLMGLDVDGISGSGVTVVGFRYSKLLVSSLLTALAVSV